MNGLSRQTRMVAGLSAVAIHIAIGANLMRSTFPPTGEVDPDPQHVLVVEMIPLSTTPQPSRIVPASRGTDARVPARVGVAAAKIADPGTPTGTIGSALFEAPLIVGANAPAGAKPFAMVPGRNASSFQRELLAHIERFRRYPEKARRDGVEGVALLSFAMDRDGTIVDAWVEQGSGSVTLDAEALAAIQRAQPLPTIPPSLPDRLTIALPIAFSLN